MLLGARQFFERRGAPTPPLPYDAEVEYLQCTGTQYIDTGVHGRDDLDIVTNVFLPASASEVIGMNPIFGCAGRTTAYQIGVRHNSTAFASGLNTKFQSSANSAVFGEWVELELDTTSGAKHFYVNGIAKRSINNSNDEVSTSTIYLFGFSALDGTASFGQGNFSIRGFTVKDVVTNKTLIDLIPVRFTNELGQSEGAMYDRASGQLFRNAGTGAFTIGPDES